MVSLALLTRQTLAPTAGVTVLRAAPGSGKTRSLIQAIIAAGDGRKVLWAVRDTIGRDERSLARETQHAFTEASGDTISPQIVLGQPHFQGDMDTYLGQFHWAQPVVIVSHAHVPLVFSADAPSRLKVLQAAELLVIDEDPLSSLLVQMGAASGSLQPWPLDDFLTVLATVDPDPSSRRALAALRFPATGRLDASLRRRLTCRPLLGHKDITECSVRGELFWELTAPSLKSVVENGHTRRLASALTQHLRRTSSVRDRLASREATLLVNAMEDDLRRYQRGEVTQRFGWHWREKSGVPEIVGLYADLLRPLIRLPQTLILDAYADLGQYQRMFPQEECRVRSPVTRSRPIHVQIVRNARLDRIDLQRNRNGRKYRLLLQDIAQDVRRGARNQLLIVPKSARPRLLSDLEALSPAAAALTDIVEVTSWHAGRGQNAYADWDVRALTCPHLPLNVEEATLSALYPLEQEREARHALRKHMERSELLQMLQRGRQAQSKASSAPRITMHFPPCDLCPKEAQSRCAFHQRGEPQPCFHWSELLILGVYEPTVVIRGDSRNPRLGQTIRETAEGLEKMLHGVPIIVLEALGLIITSRLSIHKRRELDEIVTQLLKWRVKTPWPAFLAWQEHARAHEHSRVQLEQFWRDRDTEPSRDRSQQAIREVLEDMGLRRYHVKASRRSAYPVHARTPDDAQRALAKLGAHFRGATTVAPDGSTRETDRHDTGHGGDAE